RALVEPRPGARRLRSARPHRRPQDHPPGDGKPDWLDPGDCLPDALPVQTQGPDSDRGPARDPRRPRRPSGLGVKSGGAGGTAAWAATNLGTLKGSQTSREGPPGGKPPRPNAVAVAVAGRLPAAAA